MHFNNENIILHIRKYTNGRYEENSRKILHSPALYNKAGDVPLFHQKCSELSMKTPPKLLAPLRVFKVESVDGGGYAVHARWGKPEASKGHIHRVPMKAPNADDPASAKTEVDTEPFSREGEEIVIETPCLILVLQKVAQSDVRSSLKLTRAQRLPGSSSQDPL